MNQAAFSLEDRKELQGAVQNETFIGRREREQVSYIRQNSELVIAKLLSLGDVRGLSSRLYNSC